MLPEKVLLFGLCRFLVRKAIHQNQNTKAFSENGEEDQEDEKIFSELRQEVEKKTVSESLRLMVEFLGVYQKLKFHLRVKKIQELKELTNKETYTKDIILLASSYPNSFKTLMGCLESYNGTYIFLDYLKKYLLAVELVSNRTGDFAAIKESRWLLLSGLREVRTKKSQLMKENI